MVDRKNEQRFKNILFGAGFLTEEREERSFSTLFGSWQERVSLDLSLPMEAIELIVEEEKRAGKISPKLRAQEVLNLAALEEAQREL